MHAPQTPFEPPASPEYKTYSGRHGASWLAAQHARPMDGNSASETQQNHKYSIIP